MRVFTNIIIFLLIAVSFYFKQQSISNQKKLNESFTLKSELENNLLLGYTTETLLQSNIIDIPKYLTGSDSTFLVFSFQESNCNPCVDKSLSKINTLESIVGKENIKVFGINVSPISLRILADKYDINCEMISLETESIYGEIYYPHWYTFKGGAINYVYFPNKEVDDVLNSYLSIVTSFIKQKV